MIPINNNKEPTKSFTDAIFTKKIYYKFDYNPPFPHSYIKTPRFMNFTNLIETSLLIITMYLGAILQVILMTYSDW